MSIIATSFCSRAQYIFSGKIEYERKVNVHAQLDEMDDNEWMQKMKANIPKFNSSYFDLAFDASKTCYKPGREVEGQMKMMFGNGPATENTVYTDVTKGTVKSQKSVYEQKFLVEDSTHHLQWKEKEEIRNIAGHPCHKAVATICDSVVVVAFYAEDIPVSGGPEMFGGLPGMILELAVPRLHTTWVADKISQDAPPATDFVIPEKGKKVTQAQMMGTLKDSFKDWGKMANRNMWWTYL